MRKKKVTKSLTAMLALLLIASACIGTTVAFLQDITSPVENVFDPSSVPPQIHEEITGGVKNNVRIENTGDVKAYVRAAVVVTWQDGQGNVYHTAPKAGDDYSITYNKNQQSDYGNGEWIQGSDGFYYWSKPVAANGSTGILFTGCAPVTEKTPAGYNLSVEIIASTIQAEPTSVVATKWGVTFGSDGTTITGGAQ